MTKRIELTKGQYALVDDADYENLNRFKWYCSGKGKFYAARRTRDNEKPKRALQYMHRQILELQCSDVQVDHINGNSLDNRRSNLRLVTRAENMQNTIRAIAQIGVGYDRTHNRYKAYVNQNTPGGVKRINVGTFKTRDEAIEARETFLRSLKA